MTGTYTVVVIEGRRDRIIDCPRDGRPVVPEAPMRSDLIVSALPITWLASADLLIELYRPDGGQHTVVHDPATDDFVALPGWTEGALAVALSPDGGR